MYQQKQFQFLSHLKPVEYPYFLLNFSKLNYEILPSLSSNSDL